MTETKNPQAPERGVKQMCDLAMLNLAACHAELKPGSTTKHFLREVMDMVAQYDNPSVVDPIAIIMQFLGPELRAKGVDWVAAQPFGPILVSAAYCVRALANLKSDFNELAWSNTADAMFWCGVANTSKGVGALISEVHTEARAEGEAQANSKNGRSGAKKRDEGIEPLRVLARRYARRADVKWSSRTQAAKAIFRELQKVCEEHALTGNVKASPPTVGTIHTWLRAMPDAASLFPSGKMSK